MMSDAHIIIGAAWCLVGYLCGAGAMVCLLWRRITRPGDATVRLLRMQIDDDMKRLARQQDIIDELTAQVAQLYRDQARLARRMAETSADRAEAEADASGRVA